MDERFKEHDELNQLLIFEIKSWIGRNLLRKRSVIPAKHRPILLDIGAGSNYTEGWIHIDFYKIKNPMKGFMKSMKRSDKYIMVETDFRYGLNCNDNVVDGVYTSHTIEHLTYYHAYNLLKEIFRVLKWGSWARIIVPDLELYIRYYNHENNLFIFQTGCEAISSLTQDWGHKSVWDKYLLKSILNDIGFKNIKVVAYGNEGTDKQLIKEEDIRRAESLVIEAQKTN